MSKKWNDLKELLKINLVYMNGNLYRQQLEKQREQDKVDESIFKKIFSFHLMSMLGMAILYIVIMLPFPLDKFPRYFDNMVIFLLFIGIVQSYTLFYNVLYEAQDMESYLPLPLEPRLIYISKLLAVLLGSAIFVLPIAGMAMVLLFKMKVSIWAIIGMFPFTLLLVASILILVNLMLMELVIRTGLVKIFSKKIMTFINIFMQIAMIAAVFWMQFNSMNMDFNESGNIQYGFFSQFLAPNGNKLFFYGLGIGIIILTIFGVYVLGKNFREKFLMLQQMKPKKKKINQSKLKVSSRRNSILKYKLSLLTDATIISQAILFPIIFLVSPIIGVLNMGSEVSTKNSGLILLIFALFIPIILAGVPYNLPELIISLDNENYEFLKSLPINRREYVILSGITAGIVSAIVPLLGLIIIGNLLKTNIGIFLLAIIVFISHHLLLSVKNAIKDEKNPSIGWKSVAEIFNRSSKYKLFFRMMGYLILLQIVLFGGVVLVSTVFLNVSFYSMIITFLVISLFIGLVHYLRLEEILKDL